MKMGMEEESSKKKHEYKIYRTNVEYREWAKKDK